MSPLAARSALRRVERVFDAAFGADANPWRQLGALGVLLFGTLAASGAVLYVWLDTSAVDAYRSIERLSREHPASGGLLRSVHRYAADAFVVVLVLHVVREAVHGRFRHFRRATWLTGVPLLPLAFVCAIVGFWLHWDALGQYSATATAEWIDAWPLFGSPLQRNLLAGAVSDRLFSLFVFVHVGVPLLIVFGLWFHLQRLSRPVVWPSRTLAVGTAAVLVALGLLAPVQSHPPADLSSAPQALALDWWLLFVHPLAEATSNGAAWALVVAVLALLFALPWWPGAARAPAARVDPAHCSGCARCADDCPTGAIVMVPHAMRRGRAMAHVNADLCAACGICVGACPSATPSRAASSSGIELPRRPVLALRDELRRGLAARGPGTRVVFACDHAAAADAGDALVLAVPCAGMLPPSFADFALRAGAGGVTVAGCAGCEFRLGRRWTEQRFAGQRAPRLAAAMRERVALAWADPVEAGR